MADPDRISRLLARRGLLAIAGLVVLGMLVLTLRHERFVDLWLTPEQQATRALAAGDFETAAARFADPFWRGVAWYRGREFERAAAEFGRVATPESALGAGNSLMLLGRYDDAIANYDRALELRPDWPAAATNRAIAVVRRERRNVKGDDAGGTDGKLGADEFVFDGEPGPGGADAKTAGEGEPLSDEAVCARCGCGACRRSRRTTCA